MWVDLYDIKNLPLGYIDPGIGSMILQVIMGAIIGTVVFFRQAISRVFLWIKSKLSDRKNDK